MAKKEFDVVIVGAGFAGCLMARDLAANGFSVGLYEAMPAGKPLKPLIIEMERSIFDRVGLPQPTGDEIPYHPALLRALSPRGRVGFTLENTNMPVAVYQDRQVEKICNMAVKAGAKYFTGHAATGPVVEDGRVTGVSFHTGRGRVQTVGARLVVDASGFNAALVRRLPVSMGFNFPEGENHVLVAENRLHKIDVEKARAAVARGVHGDDELWARFGNYGAYSTVFSFLSTKAERAYILIGYKRGASDMTADINRFRESQGYYAGEICGGRGFIRIHHSLDRLVADGFMVVGEAACMVIPVNGSGAASALYAGQLASQTASVALEAGDLSTKALWPYAAAYQQSRGRILAALDVSRLVIDKFSSEQVGSMIEDGLMTAEELDNTNKLRAPGKIRARSIPGRLRALVKNPEMAPRLVGMGLRLVKVLEHYKKYPATYDPRAFESWRARSSKLFDM
ncbi:MAG: NAD(P)/FAD-dependent oxidoreductase [Myxococcota bacterium]|jgi:flavin-dependent dehydrogenase